MASTTLGWQWPVEQTAMPAAKSRKAFPSISSTMAPRPFLATSGYSRVNDGDMNFASSSITLLACGPGSSMSSRGNFVSAAVIIFLSSFPIAMDGQRLMWEGCRRADLRAHTDWGCALPRREDLIDAVEARTFFGRNKNAGDFDGFGDFHLRFQRTLPSFASSMIIPRSASSLRMRSAVAKSRFFFA